MKKTALMIALITASAVLFAACGNKTKAEAPAAETAVEETAAEETEAAAEETEAVAEETEAEEAAAEEAAAETEAAVEEAAEEEAPEEEAPVEDVILDNGLFSVTIPAYFAGGCEAEYNEENNGIYVYDKASKEAGGGGFAFGIEAFEDPNAHAWYPGATKVGELTDGEGTIYDIELVHPTDVQWDPSIGPDAYMELYEAGAEIVKGLTSTDGGQFVYGSGTKGEDLYPEILRKAVTAVSEEWDIFKLAEEDMSPMYYTLALDGRGDVFDRIGYAYADLDQDGVDELMIGEIAEDDRKGIIYDLYTMKDRVPSHVISGTGKDRLFAGTAGFIYNEFTEGSDVEGLRIYSLDAASEGLLPQIVFKTDTYENEEQPWFISYDPEDEDAWENVTEEDWNIYRQNFLDYQRFDYTALAEVRDEVEAFTAVDVYRDLLRGADYGEEPAVVITQTKPSADAVGSAIAYAYLLNEIGVDAKAAVGGEISEELAAVLESIGAELPEVAEETGEDQFILIDHSSYDAAIEGLEEARILGIVDRHGIGDVVSAGPVNIRVAPVGSTATLVFKAYEECGVKIPRDVARVLLMGIVSETGNMSRYYTAMDKQAYAALKNIAKIRDFESFTEAVAAAEVIEEEEAETEEALTETEEGDPETADEAESVLVGEEDAEAEAAIEEAEKAEAETSEEEAALEETEEEETKAEEADLPEEIAEAEEEETKEEAAEIAAEETEEELSEEETEALIEEEAETKEEAAEAEPAEEEAEPSEEEEAEAEAEASQSALPKKSSFKSSSAPEKDTAPKATALPGHT